MIAQIKILCKGFSVPDYRNGETAEDIDRKELLINSNTISVRRETYNLDDEELLAWLKFVRNLVDVSIQKEEERIKKEKKEVKDLGWANGWGDNYPEIVAKCTHRQKVEKTGRCEHRHTCEICGYTYMVDSSD